MSSPETRQVVLDGARGLHLRRFGGVGRPIVLLHESPRSSAVLAPLATRLAHRFTLFALDTPGYGSSDPLVMQRPEIADFADAVARSLRAVGLTRAPVYGTHTGATIAVELARRHPDLVGGLVLDGYPVFTVEERDLHHGFYMKDFPARWDGDHVVELWSRIRDQFDFFPWYLRSESARLPAPKADLARHRAVLRDFLLSGPHYGVAYAASFRFDGREALSGQSVPIRIVARPNDLLFSQMTRLEALPPDCTISQISADPDAWAATIGDLFDEMPGDSAPPPETNEVAFGLTGLLAAIDGRMLARAYGSATETRTPLLLLHDSPGSAEQLQDLALRLGRERCVLVPELPNHGRSVELAPGVEVMDTIALLLAALDSRPGPLWHVVGFGAGGDLARLLASQAPGRIAEVIEVAAPGDSGEPAQDRLPPRWDGADLLEQWFASRDLTLFAPDGARRANEVGADVESIHRRFVASVLGRGRDRAAAVAVRAALDQAGPAVRASTRIAAAAAAPEGPYSVVLAEKIREVMRAADATRGSSDPQ
jgi:pimeloyl-ACP methyl ester carboxylesterase